MSDKPIARVIKQKSDWYGLNTLLCQRHEFPYTVKITTGEPKRSEKQNRLLYQWYMDADAQGDQTASEVRAECKLILGVPMLRAENEDFRAQYDALIRPMTYEQKLALMLPPIEFPVTSLMTVKQKTKFLDLVWQRFTSNGIHLTDPNLLGLDDCIRRGV